MTRLQARRFSTRAVTLIDERRSLDTIDATGKASLEVSMVCVVEWSSLGLRGKDFVMRRGSERPSEYNMRG